MALFCSIMVSQHGASLPLFLLFLMFCQGSGKSSVSEAEIDTNGRVLGLNKYKRISPNKLQSHVSFFIILLLSYRFCNASRSAKTSQNGKFFVFHCNYLSYALPLLNSLVEVVLQNSESLDGDNTGRNKTGADESEMICELKFGSYCLWRQQQREKMEDSVVKRMKDLLFVARAYYPSIAKLPELDKLSHELRQNIQDFERVLSETTTDKDLPPQ